MFSASSRSRHPAGLEKLPERLAAEGGDHFGIRNPLAARQLLQAEEARAVVHHRMPVQPPHHVLFLLRQAMHRLLGVYQEQASHFLVGKRMEEAVQPQSAGAKLEIEQVLLHSTIKQGQTTFSVNTPLASLASFIIRGAAKKNVVCP